MRYFSMFSGIGGFEIGIYNGFRKISQGNEKTKTSIKSLETSKQSLLRQRRLPSYNKGQKTICVGYSEIDKYATAIYKYHFKGVKNYGDATKIKTEELSDFDLLVGGFPCQSFSIAGKGRGFQDSRGTLFFEITRILRDKRPRYFLLENVKGLLSNKSGETFQTILGILSNLGYVLQWEILNSKNFGVPQNRERVLIIGHLREECRPEVFPIGESNQGSIQTHENQSGKRQGFRSNNISATIHVRTGSMARGQQMIALTEARTEEAKQIRREIQKQGKDWSPRRAKNLVPRLDDKANAITSGQSKEHFLTDFARIRRLTPIECERLQGFPDNWTKYGIDEKGKRIEISDTQRYKVLGNAVTVNVIEYVISKLLKGVTSV